MIGHLVGITMRSIWMIIIALFLIELFSYVTGTFGQIFALVFVFVLAFFHDVIGRKNVLIFLAASTLIAFSDTFLVANTSLAFVHTLARISSTSSTFLLIFIAAFTFAQLYAYTLTLYYISLHLIRRWRIYDRCGNMSF